MSSPQPAPRGARWFTAAEAAARLRCSEREIRRRCVGEWLASGLAERRKAAGAGKALWHVRSDADPALLNPSFAIADHEQWMALTASQRATANQRKAILDRLDRFVPGRLREGRNRTAAVREFVRILHAEGSPVAERTLRLWEKHFRSGGLLGLVDGRSRGPTGRLCSLLDPFLEEVKRIYLSLRRPKLTVCHEIACLKADESGWEKRSYKTCQRFIDSLPKAVVLKMRFGQEAHTNDAAPFVERDYTTLDAGEVYCGDHHQFDVVVSHRGRLVRPWLTAWQDVRSRKIVGWSIFPHDPNQDTILAAFRLAVLSHGIPQTCYIDNGKDYDSFALQGQTKMQRRRRRLSFDGQHVAGVFTQLGVTTTHCEPYHGQSKPIERFFGTLEDRFGRTWETYCGNSPQNKPEDLEVKLRAGKAPSLDDFIAAFGLWVENDYHARGHAGDGMDGRSPNQIYAETLTAKRTASPELLDLLLLRPTRPIKVTQNGVTWEGIHYGQFEPALHQLIGQTVTLRVDPQDITRVSIWSLEGRFICIAPANARVPFMADQATKREAIANVRRMRKLDAEHRRIRPRLTEDLTDAMIRAAQKRNAEAGTDKPDPGLPPPSLRPIRSPLEEQLPAFRRALQRPKIAVGAEAMPDIRNYVPMRHDEDFERPQLDITKYLKIRREDSDE